MNLSFHPAGRHFLHIPGPSPVPDRVLRALSYPTIDHRGPEFAELARKVLDGIERVFQTRHPVIIYPASGTGAWEGALVNITDPGDRVLMYETGHFAALWTRLAERIGLKPETIGLSGYCADTGLPYGWRHGVQADRIEQRLREDTGHSIRAVCVVHNETSTGVTSDIASVRKAIDAAGHPALLLVDTISGLGSAEYRHDEWGVDVSVAGSQKGLMLPPGISFNAVSERAIERSRRSTTPRGFWDWGEIIQANQAGSWPYTPNTNMLYALHEALDMLLTEGMDAVFMRHQRLAAACREGVRAWGLSIQCADPLAHSPVLTGVVTPTGVDADQVRKIIYEHFNLSLGTGLGKLKGRMFRIGHLGECNELSLMAAITGCEMGLRLAGVRLTGSGVAAAMDYLTETAQVQARYPVNKSVRDF